MEELEIQEEYSDDLIQSELYNTIKRGDKLTVVEFLLCSRDLKEMWLLKHKDIGILEFKSCDDDLKKIYIDNIANSKRAIGLTKFQILSKELKNYYFSLVVPIKEITLEYNVFIEATDSQKIEYIIFRGLDNVGWDIKDWYGKWRKIKRRDLNIDKILLEE